MQKERVCLAIPTHLLVENDLIPSGVVDLPVYTTFKDIGDILKFVKIARTSSEVKNRDGLESVENNHDFQQLAMYAFVVKNNGTFLIYQRTENAKISDNRLTGKVSVGIGGHMEPSDENLVQSFYREFGEEAEIFENDKKVNIFGTNEKIDVPLLKKYLTITPTGLIKDNDAIGAFHVGITCKITPKNDNIEVRIKVGYGEENLSWQYINAAEYLKMKEAGQITPEGWTEIVFQNELSNNLPKE